MVLQISNEDAYLHYFKQLIELDNLANKSKTDKLQKFEITPFGKKHTTKMCKTKKSNTIKNVKNNTVPVKELIKEPRSSKNKTLEEITLKVDFTLELNARIQLRRTMLDEFEIYCYDKELYDSFINRLIEFEESLLITC